MSMTLYGRQSISEDDIQAIVHVLRSDFLTKGPVVSVFEKEVVAHCGANFAAAVNSATSALHVAFVASANCPRYCGADVDIDARTCNMSVNCLCEKLEQAEKTGGRPK